VKPLKKFATLGALLITFTYSLSFWFAPPTEGDNPSPSTISSKISTPEVPASASSKDLWGQLTDLVESQGPAAAVAHLDGVLESDPSSVGICHGMYEHIGRESTRVARGLPDYYTPACQFGFVHGALYALAGKHSGGGPLLDEVVPYCEKFLEDKTTLSPRSSCYHGLGHLLAGVYRNQPLTALQYCTEIPTLIQMGCVDGALMEYGEDNLVRTGWMRTESHGNSSVETEIPSGEVASLCSKVSPYAAPRCFGRVWMFLGPLSLPTLEAGAAVCNKAPSPETYARCHEGFGEFAVLVDSQEYSFNWPPKDAREAEIIARRMVERCSAFQEPTLCLTGGIMSSVTHLFALELDPELVPNPCNYLTDSNSVEKCQKSMDRAKDLNWDKSGQPT